MLLVRLLWDPLPDTLPALGRRRFPGLRDLVAAMTANTAPMSEQERVNRRVLRGAIQALVRETYLATAAEQDSEHRPPAALPRRGEPAWSGCWTRPVSICPVGHLSDHLPRHRSGL
jgi:hypothetical protein